MTTAYILSTGNELFGNPGMDSNSVWISSMLYDLGIDVIGKSVIIDDATSIADGVRYATCTADIVIISGGLGPTGDDLTRDAIAKVMGVELHIDEECLQQVCSYFTRTNRPMPEINKRQAMIPKGASAILNSIGTAPGIRTTINNAVVYALPGVSLEMKEMFVSFVRPDLPDNGIINHSEVLKIYGIGESTLVEMLGDLAYSDDDYSTGITLSDGMITIKISRCGTDVDQVKSSLARRSDTIADILGKHVVCRSADGNMPKSLGKLLDSRGMTLSTAESCTGGMIGQMLTSVPGSSTCYLGGIICYSNQMKINSLGVDSNLIETHGAVSQQVADAMARCARDKYGSHWAIAVTGIAGPAGGSDEKPVGLVYTAIAGDNILETNRRVFTGDRNTIRMRAALAALNDLRLKIL